MESVIAKYLWSVFQGDNGWGAQKYSTRDGREFTAVGTDLPEQTGVHYRLHGETEIHRKYGKRFVVESYEIACVTEEDALIFLCTLPGIGRKTAKKITTHFGQEVIDILQTHPERLLEVPGIPKKAKTEAVEALRKNVVLARLFRDLSVFGVSMRQCKALISWLGNSAEDLIRDDPYRMVTATGSGITFPMADAVAAKLGIPRDDPRRVQGAAACVIRDHEDRTGNTRMPEQCFFPALSSLLGQQSEDCVYKVDLDGQVVFERYFGVNTVARSCTSWNEYDIARQLLRLATSCDEQPSGYIWDVIKDVSTALGLVLSDEQEDAVYRAAKHRVSITTGFPGTGKTTVIRVMADVIQRLYGLECLCLAPTGIAARRIESCSGLRSSTIHSALKIYSEEGEVEEELRDLFIIVDETSMLDSSLMGILLRAVCGRSRIVFLGDTDQLQSVRPGAVLRDLVTSCTLPVTRLTKVFRSDVTSVDLNENAARIRRGDADLRTGRGFITAFGLSGEALEDKMLSFYMKAVNKFGPDACCLIAPVKEGPAGVKALNARAREMLNPAAWGKDEMEIGGTLFRVGDRVMEQKNAETSVNGDVGYIDEINAAEGAIHVSFLSGEATIYTREDRDRLTHAYALTVHKAQGSEYDVIVTCLQDGNSFMKRRSIVYTAVTRAKKFVVYAGSKAALEAAILTDDSTARITGLETIIRKTFEDHENQKKEEKKDAVIRSSSEALVLYGDQGKW